MIKKIRILYHLNQLGYGGTEKAILTFAKNIDRALFDLYLYVPGYKGSLRHYRHQFLSYFSKKYQDRLKYFSNRIEANRDEFVKVFGADKVKIGSSFLFFEVLKKEKMDIVHFNRGTEEDFFTSKMNKIPKNIAIVETNIFARPSNLDYWSRLEKSFFVSNYCLAKSPWHQGKGDVLYNPIRIPHKSRHFRDQLGIPKDAVVLGQIGRPDLFQDDWIYKVYRANEDLGVHLIVLGCTQKLKELSRKGDRIHLIEATSDVSVVDCFFSTIDILLHRRIDGETFGMNIAEALISGVPVVSHASDVDNAQKELLDKNDFGPVGFVSDRDDIESYSKFVRSLIQNSDLREELGRNAKKKAMTLYEEKKVTQQLEQKYLDVLKSFSPLL